MSLCPHSADARPRIYYGRVIWLVGCSHGPSAAVDRRYNHISAYWQFLYCKVTLCVLEGCMLTIKLRRWSSLGWWLETSFLYSSISEVRCVCVSLSLSLSLWGIWQLSRLSAHRRKHVAKEMWSDAEGWRRSCLQRRWPSGAGQGGDTACLIDYLIRLN